MEDQSPQIRPQKRERTLRVVVFEPKHTIEELRDQLNRLADMARALRVPSFASADAKKFSTRAQAGLHLSAAGDAITQGDIARSQIAITFLYGYLMALHDTSRSKKLDEAQAAGKARGRSSTDRIRLAAEPFRAGRLSKAAVAARIAPTVELSAARVETLLSEIYPGASWKGKTPVVSNQDGGS